jgi:hypothetical protein
MWVGDAGLQTSEKKDALLDSINIWKLSCASRLCWVVLSCAYMPQTGSNYHYALRPLRAHPLRTPLVVPHWRYITYESLSST